MSKHPKNKVTRHVKTGNVILSQENANEHYIEWKEALLTHINHESLPDDYTKAHKYSDHLSRWITMPAIADFTGTDGEKKHSIQMK